MSAPPAPADDPTPSLAAKCVRALLERHGIPRHKHSPLVADLLGLSYQQGHRRLTTPAPWSLEELQLVATAYGESLSALVAAEQNDGSHPGVLLVGTLRTPCKLWVGRPVERAQAGRLVAIRADSEWVVTVDPQGVLPNAHSVHRLVVEYPEPRSTTVAVLDDDANIADSLAAGLVALGYDATAFSDEAALRARLEEQPFDAYIIDWVLPTGSAQDLIRFIRARDPRCSIAILTGKLQSEAVDETEVLGSISANKLLLLQKPVTAAIIASQLEQAMASK